MKDKNDRWLDQTKVLGCISAMLPCSEDITSSHIQPLGSDQVGQIIPRVWHINSGCFTSGYHSKDLMSEEFRN